MQAGTAKGGPQPAAASGATHSWRWVGHAAARHSCEQKRALWQRLHLRSRLLSGRLSAPQLAQARRRRELRVAAAALAPATAAVLPPAAAHQTAGAGVGCRAGGGASSATCAACSARRVRQTAATAARRDCSTAASPEWRMKCIRGSSRAGGVGSGVGRPSLCYSHVYGPDWHECQHDGHCEQCNCQPCRWIGRRIFEGINAPML